MTEIMQPDLAQPARELRGFPMTTATPVPRARFRCFDERTIVALGTMISGSLPFAFPRNLDRSGGARRIGIIHGRSGEAEDLIGAGGAVALVRVYVMFRLSFRE